MTIEIAERSSALRGAKLFILINLTKSIDKGFLIKKKIPINSVCGKIKFSSFTALLYYGFNVLRVVYFHDFYSVRVKLSNFSEMILLLFNITNPILEHWL